MKEIQNFWTYQPKKLLELLDSRSTGLTDGEAYARLKAQKPAVAKHSYLVRQLLFFARQYSNPLILLLIVAAVLSGILKEYSDSIIILAVLLMMGVFSYMQERFASKAVEDLQQGLHNKSTVLRSSIEKDIYTEEVVQGDIVLLNAGDIIPADGLLLESNDLHVNESALTGESFPVEKFSGEVKAAASIHEISNSVYKGTSVVNGTATMLAVHTTENSEFDRITARLAGMSKQNAFEKGVTRLGYMILYVTVIVSVLILIINILLNKPVFNSLLFSLAIAVGLAPELLPAILTVTMATGAKKMALKHVIVKRLDAIQNLGEMDVLCSDKTGTVTEGVVKLDACLDYNGKVSDAIKRYAFINAYFETGFNNPIDDSLRSLPGIDIAGINKTDEVPYDFIRKRLSIVVEERGKHTMVTKGALKNVLDVCSKAMNVTAETVGIDQVKSAIDELGSSKNEMGYRCLGVAIKDVSNDPVINKDDESDMTFIGVLTFQDPLKEGIKNSLASLRANGIKLKLITGDNMAVSKHIASELGIDTGRVVSGEDLLRINKDTLQRMVSNYDLFAETEPSQKEAIITALQANGHTVGYLGDGINDAQALKCADAGISVNTAVDVARESASVVLLDKNLDALIDGVVEGRKTFINTQKYIFLTTSANFGNMFSMAVLSVVLPFLPLLPTQILLNNFLSDIPTLAIARDRVDDQLVKKPTGWNVAGIKKFMLVFGFQSSVFDMLTFLLLLYMFRTAPDIFRTAWFLESLTTEVLIVFVIRTRKPFMKSRPSLYLLVLSASVLFIAFILPFLPLGSLVGLVPLPTSAVMIVVGVSLAYGFTSELLKRKYLSL